MNPREASSLAVHKDLPSLARFVEALPRGLDSCPEYEVKGSLVREVAAHTTLQDAEIFPAELLSLVRNPPAVSTWVREAHFNALMLAIFDLQVARTGNPRVMHEAAYAQTKALLNTALYRILFVLMSPERLLSGLEKRWSALRRGTRIELRESTAGMACIRMHYAPHLYTQLLVEFRAESLRAALECAGGKHCKSRVALYTPTLSDFVLVWS
ncbi:MAG: hypothetical protein Q8Q09_19610 [Deltaproteobacteria bacterium]|nr:hypothetical protein [Deltaproteobacteria bacterium]